MLADINTSASRLSVKLQPNAGARVNDGEKLVPRNKFETELQNGQRSKDLRKLNDALKHRSDDEILSDPIAAVKLAEAILRAQKPE